MELDGKGHRANSFVGKSSVINELRANAKTAIEQPPGVAVHRIIVDGDYVVVEMSWHNTTTDGKIDNNKYWWVCRITAGKLRALNFLTLHSFAE